MLGFRMRFGTFACAVLAFLLWAAGCNAQTREDVTRCRAIEDDVRRLDCYDAIRVSPTSVRSKYEPVPLAELTSYALSYRGRLLEVIGWIRPAGSFLVIGEGEADAIALPVDIRALPRQEQDRLAQQCRSGCKATVQGRISPVNFVTGIVAETILVH